MQDALEINGELPVEPRRVVRRYNWKILTYLSGRIMPFAHPGLGRWFDDSAVPPNILGELEAHGQRK